ncbi:MAG: hypothetical protein JW837_07715 [Sedimentisphaerales bacterium]|nr:hypothetical protein [Sedimentisphaerales bacterium]
MKRAIIFVTLVFVFTASPAFADLYGGTGSLTQTGSIYGINYSSNSGGEFTISNSSLDTSEYLSGITSDIKGQSNSFQTFCMEKQEYTASAIEIWISTTSINESTGAIGSEGSGSHAIYGGLKYGDNLNPATAYLYTNFAQGTLSNYNYETGRAVSAGQLQNAIWYLEGEISSLATNSQAYAWVTEAQNVGWNDIGNVRVLNNWIQGHVGDPEYRVQDQLYLMPISTPIPGSVILGFIGMSVVGIKLRKYA